MEFVCRETGVGRSAQIESSYRCDAVVHIHSYWMGRRYNPDINQEIKVCEEPSDKKSRPRSSGDTEIALVSPTVFKSTIQSESRFPMHFCTNGIPNLIRNVPSVGVIFVLDNLDVSNRNPITESDIIKIGQVDLARVIVRFNRTTGVIQQSWRCRVDG